MLSRQSRLENIVQDRIPGQPSRSNVAKSKSKGSRNKSKKGRPQPAYSLAGPRPQPSAQSEDDEDDEDDEDGRPKPQWGLAKPFSHSKLGGRNQGGTQKGSRTGHPKGQVSVANSFYLSSQYLTLLNR